MSKKYVYRVFDRANNINSILKTTIPIKSDYNLWGSLIGNYSDEGGFEIYYGSSNQYRDNYFGPFMKAHVTASNINWPGDVCKVVIRRVNGNLYYTYLLITICVGTFFVTKSIINLIEKGELLEVNQHIIPLICGVFILLIELWAMLAIYKLNNKILKMLIDNNIELEKLQL